MKKTLFVYGVFAFFSLLLLGMGKMIGLSTREYAIFILPIIFFVGLVPLLVDNVGTVCLMLAWLPFSRGVAQFELGVMTLNPYVVGMTGLVVIALLQIVFGKIRYRITTVDLLILSITVIYFVSTLLSDDIVSSGYLAFHAIYVPVISYFVVRTLLRNDDDFEKAVIFFILSVTVFSLMAVTQFIVTSQRVAMLGMPFIGVATLTTTGLILLFGTRRWKKPFWMLCAFLILLGIVVSFSRVYLVIVVLSPFLYKWIRSGKSKPLILAILIGSLIGTLIISINPEPFKPDHFDRSLERSFERITSLDFWKGSIYGRAYSYNDGLKRFLGSPLIGHGLKKGEINITTHNYHVEWLEYSGLFGYLLWFLLFYQHFKRMSVPAMEDKYISTCLLMISMVLINSVTNGFMHGVMPTVTFILIGINEARLRSLKASDFVTDFNLLKKSTRQFVERV